MTSRDRSAEPAAARRLVSLPARAAQWLNTSCAAPGWFAAGDPPGTPLGSGGGLASLLATARAHEGGAATWEEWLAAKASVVVLGGAPSHALPPYDPWGVPLTPMPVLRGSFGQRLDQTLLDLQTPWLDRILAAAHPVSSVLVSSGDTLLRFSGVLGRLPEADVVIVGVRLEPELARSFGLLFMEPQGGRLAFVEQKPEPRRIRRLASERKYLADTGVWLLSARAVTRLLRRTGCLDGFNSAEPLDLYRVLGESLGSQPLRRDDHFSDLTCAVAEAPNAEFLHLNSARNLIQAVSVLQTSRLGRRGAAVLRSHPDQIAQNARFDPSTRLERSHTLWIENADVPASWQLQHEHMITGAPANEWRLALTAGACLDFPAVGDGLVCLRPFGLDDRLDGLASESTMMGRSIAQWLADRGLDAAVAGIDLAMSARQAPLFPVSAVSEIDPDFVAWLTSPGSDAAHWAGRWLAGPRLSAEEIGERYGFAAVAGERRSRSADALAAIYGHRGTSVFYRLDLEAAARLSGDAATRTGGPLDIAEPMDIVHEHMWRAEVARVAGGDPEPEERLAFGCLREAVLNGLPDARVTPVCSVLRDQIVWARAPLRLDLAGGWTDTPPYCLQHGGRVVNVAVDLNGQPPIQVFVKPSQRHGILIRSIDAGTEELLTTYDQIAAYDQPGCEFTLARAALALAGFLPRFSAQDGHGSLADQLGAFGCGLEVSLLAAVPQGSGLGTSSILSAALLAALSRLCGLGWDDRAVVSRVMALEQMLTTGGGWQDQIGGALRGVKLVETAPGMDQNAVVAWLPDYLLTDAPSRRRIMLYYTGLTRMAKNILKEIVRGMFLNHGPRLAILSDIGANALATADAMQRNDWAGLCEGLRCTWSLKQRLDGGTNPPSVQAVLEPVDDLLDACALMGAGGGGYLLMLAKDDEAAARVRHVLTESPPNDRARFVEPTVSGTGLEVTTS
ncbi:MAG: bifunctional fucokinase/fucose-1-phosphate guanylyltransferase [Armatimonadetes bacterium]|nr:bifunctional fucokinase/fucose-1-phosphate guanylyltransferase [Armatimonadota bacterium]